jgi:hypothetical protein
MMMRRFLIGAAIAAVVPLSACADQSSEHLMDAKEAAQIETTCYRILQVHTLAQRAYCFYSLSDTLEAQRNEQLAEKAAIDCVHRGLVTDTPGFSDCILSQRAGDRPAGMQERGVFANGIAAGTDLSGEGSAALIDLPASLNEANTSKHQREEYSCAQLGLAPYSASFDSCVEDLALALMRAKVPPPINYDPY